MSAALNALLQKASIEDPDEILKQCNESLKQNKTDVQTQHVKVVALLQLNRFDDAVRAFDQGGDLLKSQAVLEYAYSLYKVGDTKKALDVVKSQDSRGAKLLRAQLSYRLEDFEDSKKIYEALAKDPGDEINDIRINLNATYAQLVWKQQGELVTKTKADREDLEGYETAYNAACLSIARGELGQAEVLLRTAEKLCDNTLSGDQKEEELVSIRIQQLFVMTRLGKSSEAEKLIQQISSEKITDESTRWLSTINKLAASETSNPFLTQRQLGASPVLPFNDKLFGFQDLLLNKNSLALDLACGKIEGIKRSTSKQIAAIPSPTLDSQTNIASSINVAAHAQNQLGKEGLKAILPLLEKRPHDLGLISTIIQLYVMTGNNGAALHVIDKFLKQLDEAKSEAQQDARYSPGLIAIVVSLYSLAGRKAQINDELLKAATYWKTRPRAPVGLLKAAGASFLKQSSADDLKSARVIFEKLSKTNPHDRIVKAGLAASISSTDPSHTSDISSLTSVDRLIAGIDVAALNQAGIPRSSRSTAAILKRKRAEPVVSEPRKKRLRKAQLPKDFDPEKKPDPERWLPLRDRSTYRPKGKKGKQKQSAATQGSNEKPSDGGAVQEKSTVATASGGPNKSKKKKGKK